MQLLYISQGLPNFICARKREAAGAICGYVASVPEMLRLLVLENLIAQYC